MIALIVHVAMFATIGGLFGLVILTWLIALNIISAWAGRGTGMTDGGAGMAEQDFGKKQLESKRPAGKTSVFLGFLASIFVQVLITVIDVVRGDWLEQIGLIYLALYLPLGILAAVAFWLVSQRYYAGRGRVLSCSNYAMGYVITNIASNALAFAIGAAIAL